MGQLEIVAIKNPHFWGQKTLFFCNKKKPAEAGSVSFGYKV